MNPKITYISKITNGKLTRLASKGLREYLERNEGKTIEISMMRVTKRRSNEQNSYYWGVVIPIFIEGMKEAGWGSFSPMEIHDLLKEKFARREILNEQSGEIIEVPSSTTQFSTTRMMEYFTDIQKWAEEWLGIHIPEPNEQIRIEFNQESF